MLGCGSVRLLATGTPPPEQRHTYELCLTLDSKEPPTQETDWTKTKGTFGVNLKRLQTLRAFEHVMSDMRLRPKKRTSLFDWNPLSALPCRFKSLKS
jgi:hypothetical protein